MKTVKFYALFVVMILSAWLPGSAQQPTQTLRGTVTDVDSKVPLIGANIIVEGTNPLLGAATDLDGRFRIGNVPVGRHTLKVSFVGYEEKLLPEVSVNSGKEVVLNLELKERANTLVAVNITPDKDKPLNSMATVSARSFSVEEASRYAGSFSDPGRMASSFAGVVSNNSYSNEITVRGNSPNGLLWRLEGVEIPTPNHLSGYANNGGVVTVLSTNAMRNSDFMTGAFPAEYGNASSGVFDINLRNGNNEKKEYVFQASLFGLEASAEGPLKNGSKGSYLVNYRYSTTSLLGDIGLLDKNEGLPSWQDLNFKVNLPTEKAGEFQVFGVGGLSDVTENAVKDTSEWEKQYDGQNSKFHSNMGVIGLSHRIFLNENTYLKTVFAYSGRGTGHHTDTLDSQFNTYFYGQSKTTDYAATISTLVNHKFSAKSLIRAGVVANRKSYNLFAQDISPVAPYDMTTLVDSKGDYYSLQSFIQWKYRLAENLELNTGLHSMYTDFNKNTTVEPRAGIRWEFKPEQVLSFGFGIHSRLEPTSIYFEEFSENGATSQPNKDLGTGYSEQYVLGYDRKLTGSVHLKAEAYYQKHHDLPIEDAANSSFSIVNNVYPVTGMVLVNKGTATNKGVDLTIEKFFDKNYYFLLTGSVYDAKYKGGDGIERNTRYNGNYVGNFLFGKEFKLEKNRSIGLDLRFVVAGGNRITPIDLEQSRAEGITVYQEDKAFSEQAPVYFRPDVKLSFTKNKKNTRQTFALDIQNISDQQNVLTTYYDKKQDKVLKAYQLGMLPNISYRLEF